MCPNPNDQQTAARTTPVSEGGADALSRIFSSLPMPSSRAAPAAAPPAATAAAATNRSGSRVSAGSGRRRSRPRRSVSFHSRTKVYLVPTLDEMTEEEVANTWRTDEDEGITQGEIVQTVRVMRRNGGADDNSSNLTSRGLEHLGTAETIVQRKELKAQLLDAVLDDQDRQWDANLDPVDHEKIAEIAAANSQVSRDKALASAAKDAAFVRLSTRRTSDAVPTTRSTNTAAARSTTDTNPRLTSTLRAATDMSASPRSTSRAEAPSNYRSAEQRPRRASSGGEEQRPRRSSLGGGGPGYASRDRARSKSQDSA